MDSGSEGGDEQCVEQSCAPWEKAAGSSDQPMPEPHSGKRAAEEEAEAEPCKKKKVTKAALVQSQKKKSGKFVCFCPGCLLWFRTCDIAVGQKLDFICKSYMDRIYYTAKVQNQLAWYRSMRASDTKLFQAIATYREKAPVDADGGIPRTKAPTMWTYLEVLIICDGNVSIYVFV